MQIASVTSARPPLKKRERRCALFSALEEEEEEEARAPSIADMTVSAARRAAAASHENLIRACQRARRRDNDSWANDKCGLSIEGARGREGRARGNLLVIKVRGGSLFH